MERLTKVDGIGQNDLIRCFNCTIEKAGENLENCGYCEEGWREAIYRLAAYEDTGLAPEEVEAMRNTMEAYHKEADPLLRAKALGRLLVLPAAPGETVYYADEDAGRVMMGYINGYRIRNNRAISFEFFNLELDVEWHSISLPLEEFGKTVFFKEEKAEKVLGGAEYDA